MSAWFQGVVSALVVGLVVWWAASALSDGESTPAAANGPGSSSAVTAWVPCEEPGPAEPAPPQIVRTARARFIKRWGLPMHPGPQAPDRNDLNDLLAELAIGWDVDVIARTCSPYPCRARLIVHASLAEVGGVREVVRKKYEHATVSVVSRGRDRTSWAVDIVLVDRAPVDDAEDYYLWRLASLLQDDAMTP